jgi:hypothetical protein
MDINLQMYLTDHRPQTTDHSSFIFESTFKTQGPVDSDHRPQTTDHNPFNFGITFKTQGPYGLLYV